jgi:4-hydroxy-3-methylbut-2-enyl diphosphate reductase
VVASEVHGPQGDVVVVAGADLVAAALRRAGLRVHVGPVHSVARIAGARTRRIRREAGALAVDMESAWLLPIVSERPVAVVRVIVDTPEHPLASPRTLVSGVRARRVLHRVAGALEEWADACVPSPMRSSS